MSSPQLQLSNEVLFSVQITHLEFQTNEEDTLRINRLIL